MTRLSAADGAMALVWLAAHIPADLDVLLEANPDESVVLVYSVQRDSRSEVGDGDQAALEATRRLAEVIGATPEPAKPLPGDAKSVRHVWRGQSPAGVPVKVVTIVTAPSGAAS